MIPSGQRISLNDLRLGMIIGDVFNEQDVLLYSSRTLITSDHQIDSLKNQGVTSVFIVTEETVSENPGGSIEVREEEAPSGESVLAYAHYQQQLKAAGVVHEHAIDSIRDVMSSVKLGQMFQATGVLRSTELLVERVLLDPDLYFGLMQIKAMGSHAYTHSVNVAIMTAAFAGALNYPQDKIIDCAVGGMLHDIGKMKLPEALWFKNNGSCTRKEYEIFKRHPGLGIEIIDGPRRQLSGLTRTIIGQHHERWNGGGYPDALTGDAIHEMAIMCALADVYDLLTTRTPYQNACMPQEALATIFQSVDDEFPRPLAEQFARLLGIYPVGSFVNLKSGEKGLVIRVNRDSLLTPVVVVLINKLGRKLVKPFVRDLSKGSAHPSDHLGYKVDCSLDPAVYTIFPSWYFKAVAA
jgi:HD-GYP domain-containing protein (c-di-GMP phosphodiesterase class II)